LHGLSASQDLLIKSDWQGTEMGELIRAQLYHFGDLVGSQILIDGPFARLTPVVAQAVGMAIHELATNAAKYGSLSTNAGQVRIRWDISDEEVARFTIQWTEEGGPITSAPTRKGFGHLVTGRIVESALIGKVEVDFAPHGLVWKLSGLATHALEPK
jgi:two-component sensor histidine kinase